MVTQQCRIPPATMRTSLLTKPTPLAVFLLLTLVHPPESSSDIGQIRVGDKGDRVSSSAFLGAEDEGSVVSGDGGTVVGAEDGGSVIGAEDGGTVVGAGDGGSDVGADDGGSVVRAEDGCPVLGMEDGGLDATPERTVRYRRRATSEEAAHRPEDEAPKSGPEEECRVAESGRGEDEGPEDGCREATLVRVAPLALRYEEGAAPGSKGPRCTDPSSEAGDLPRNEGPSGPEATLWNMRSTLSCQSPGESHLSGGGCAPGWGDFHFRSKALRWARRAWKYSTRLYGSGGRFMDFRL